MKKIIIVMLLASLSSGAALAAYITVTQPKAGDCLTYGEPMKLKYSPNLPSKYFQGKILLLQHNQVVGTIASDIKLSDYVLSGWWWDDIGSYIGGHALTGSEYSIRVATMDDAYWGDSGYFSIGAGNLISPKENESWELGSSRTIRWVSFGFPAGEKILLHLIEQGSGKDYTIPPMNLVIGNGIKEWKWDEAGSVLGAGPHILVPAGKYHIVAHGEVYNRIVGKPFNLVSSAYSFQVMKPLGDIYFFLNVTKPVQGLTLKQGETLKIRWDQASISSYAKVKLGVYGADKATWLGTIDGKADPSKANSGQFDVTVLKVVFKPGHSYSIRVTTPDDKYSGFSGVFAVEQ